jgi:hypothetical protein
MTIGSPALKTTIVFGFALATASISSSCPAGNSIVLRSKPSDSNFGE